jgi:hypothetical protein
MRRLRSSRNGLRLLVVATMASAIVAPSARAQSASEAALFLLLPVGARSVGMGNAMSTAQTTEAIWWNPAGMAALRRGQMSLHHSQTLIGTGDALVLTLGASRLGVLSVAANLLDYGAGFDVTGDDSLPSGELFPRNVAMAASYATTIGSRIRAGVTYKLLQFRFDCSGECPSFPTREATSVDAGVQYDLPIGFPISVGAVVRNMGSDVEASESAESDPLPTRLQIGAQSSSRLPQTLANDATISLAFDLIDELPLRRPLPRVGAEFIWDSAVFIRGGYVVESADTEAGGASLGIGFVVRRLTIDFARSFSGLSADAGQAPTYLSLRVMF